LVEIAELGSLLGIACWELYDFHFYFLLWLCTGPRGLRIDIFYDTPTVFCRGEVERRNKKADRFVSVVGDFYGKVQVIF